MIFFFPLSEISHCYPWDGSDLFFFIGLPRGTLGSRMCLGLIVSAARQMVNNNFRMERWKKCTFLSFLFLSLPVRQVQISGFSEMQALIIGYIFMGFVSSGHKLIGKKKILVYVQNKAEYWVRCWCKAVQVFSGILPFFCQCGRDLCAIITGIHRL